MMKMMDRIVEGRGHLREIDMLLELTSVPLSRRLSIPDLYICLSFYIHWLLQQTDRGEDYLCPRGRCCLADSRFNEAFPT